MGFGLGLGVQGIRVYGLGGSSPVVVKLFSGLGLI